jgi:hypothetical protein
MNFWLVVIGVGVMVVGWLWFMGYIHTRKAAEKAQWSEFELESRDYAQLYVWAMHSEYVSNVAQKYLAAPDGMNKGQLKDLFYELADGKDATLLDRVYDQIIEELKGGVFKGESRN